MGKYCTVSVDVEVDLQDFETEDLIDELESRGESLVCGDDQEEVNELLSKLWHKRRNGIDYQRELDRIIYLVLGKII